MLYNRVISMFILIPATVAVLFISSVIQFSVFLFIICLISSWEWGKLMKFSSVMHYIWMYTMFGLLYSTMIMITRDSLYLNFWSILFSVFSVITIWWIFMFLLVLFYPYSSAFWNKSNILRFCFGILIIFPFFSGVLILRQLYYINNNMSGEWWLLCVLILIWINDSSAYIIGRTLGKHKLLENVSPKKTWEGCIGGILISTGMAWLLIKYIIINISNSYIVFLSFMGTILFSVVGDLTESMFKRESGVKDTNNLIPGHGGLLDRIDSLFSAVPVFTMLMLLLMRINII